MTVNDNLGIRSPAHECEDSLNTGLRIQNLEARAREARPSMPEANQGRGSLLGLVALTLVLSCGPSSTQAHAPRNVILICLDTVRADHVGAYGYARPTTPALDALAAQALVFDDASANASWTKPSVPSFLTGTYPCQHGVYEGSTHDADGLVTDLLPERALTLAEAFHSHGYRTAGFVHNGQLRPGSGFEQGYEHYEEDAMDARELRWRALDWLDQREAPERAQPFFLYLHFLEAHWPYPAPEDWLTRFAPAVDTQRFRDRNSQALVDAINAGERAFTPGDRLALEALYDGALAYLDSELGHLFAGLEQRGLAGDTIVCVLADHGEEFGEHGRVGHGHGLWENLLRVPWILAVPGRAPERNATPVSLIDLFPTLLSAAGLEAPAGLEGVNRLADPHALRAVFAEHKAPDRYFQSLRQDSQKRLRLFTVPEPSLPETVELPIAVGTRWEVGVRRDGGELVATRVEPRDEKPDEPPELKGPIEVLTDTSFVIAGVPVRYEAKCKRATEVGTSGPALANGLVVKVRGTLVEGTLQAERIKFYAPGESTEPEIRGTVVALERAGPSVLLTLGGFVVRVTGTTELDQVGLPPELRPLTREGIAALLAGGVSAQAAAKGYLGLRQRYDLARDRGELAPAEEAAGSAFDAELDELGRRLSTQRIFGAGDQKALDATAVEELRRIGYVGDEH
jgi:arylsulfatase A-like enzyme